MEGCTIAQAAYLNGVPLVVVRAISDKPCAPGPFFMLGPRRAGPFPKRSVEPKC